MPLLPAYTGRFKRDVKRLTKRGKDMNKLKRVMALLIEEIPLDSQHRDHALTGNWNAHRDCHIEPDWVLIYRVLTDEGEIRFERTGSHSDLFTYILSPTGLSYCRVAVSSTCEAFAWANVYLLRTPTCVVLP